MIIHRVRTIDIDGNKLGRVWDEKFFMQKEEAERYLTKEVDYYENFQETKYKLVIVEKVEGYCNWRHCFMICYDSVEVK